jgi:hypothetical protein
MEVFEYPCNENRAKIGDFFVEIAINRKYSAKSRLIVQTLAISTTWVEMFKF